MSKAMRVSLAEESNLVSVAAGVSARLLSVTY
jgi:hypothetical protein